VTQRKEERKGGGGGDAAALKGFASHFSLSKAQPVPRNEGTQNQRNSKLSGALGSPVCPLWRHHQGLREAPSPCLLLGTFFPALDQGLSA
jgi:hypothetical protein